MHKVLTLPAARTSIRRRSAAGATDRTPLVAQKLASVFLMRQYQLPFRNSDAEVKAQLILTAIFAAGSTQLLALVQVHRQLVQQSSGHNMVALHVSSRAGTGKQLCMPH
jgi:hypothetical protein